MSKCKYKVVDRNQGHYVVGLYDDLKLIATFKAYPDRNPDFLVLYPKEYINFVYGVDIAKKKVHYSDIEF